MVEQLIILIAQNLTTKIPPGMSSYKVMAQFLYYKVYIFQAL